jgi:regulator of replication initiation timing
MKKQKRTAKEETRIGLVSSDSTLSNVEPDVEQLRQQIQDLKERLGSAECKVMNLMMANADLKKQILNLQQHSDTGDSKRGHPSGKQSIPEQSGVRTRRPNEEKESHHISDPGSNETSLNVEPGVPVLTHYDEHGTPTFVICRGSRPSLGI